MSELTEEYGELIVGILFINIIIAVFANILLKLMSL